MSRRAGRFLPSRSVTVALLEENLPIAYGVVKDLSEAGACIMTNAVLRPGKSYQFRMSFFEGEVLEAQAKIVWNETAATGRAEVPHGLEFTDMHGPHLEQLRRLLQSTGFGSKNSH